MHSKTMLQTKFKREYPQSPARERGEDGFFDRYYGIEMERKRTMRIEFANYKRMDHIGNDPARTRTTRQNMNNVKYARIGTREGVD